MKVLSTNPSQKKTSRLAALLGLDFLSLSASPGAQTLHSLRFAGRTALVALSTLTVLCLPVQAQTYSTPITISDSNYGNGVFTGNWQSTDPNTAAVTIETSQPVIIVNSNIKGPGILINCPLDRINHNLTVRYTTAIGTNPYQNGVEQGAFIHMDYVQKLDVENCTVEGTTGIGIQAYTGDPNILGNTIIVRWNSVHNIDGRYSNGISGGYQNNGSAAPHFLQISHCYNVPGIDIGYNQIINDPYSSYITDIINFYDSSAQSGSHAEIHDNYIQGLYAPDPATQGNSGTAIICDGQANDATQTTAYVDIHDNHIVSTGNAAIGITTGHDNRFYNNTMLSSGKLPDGRWIASSNAGCQIINGNGFSNAVFYNNSATGNLVGWIDGKDPNNVFRQDYQLWDGIDGGNNSSWLPNDNQHPTVQNEMDEARAWAARLANNSWWVGNNLVIDPGFEAETGSGFYGPWQADLDPGTQAGSDFGQLGNVHTGNGNAWVHSNGSGHAACIDQTINVQANTPYTLSAYYWDLTSNLAGSAFLQVYSADWSRLIGTVNVTPSTSGYSLHSLSFATGSSDTTVHLHLGIASAADAWMRIDDVQLYDPLVKPAVPSGVKAVAGASGTKKITVSWNKMAGATSYKVYRSGSSGGTYSQISTATGLSYVNTGLTAGTTYYYKVAATNAAGTSGLSAYISARAQ